MTARKLRQQTNARFAAEAEAKSADSAPKYPKGAWGNAVAAATGTSTMDDQAAMEGGAVTAAAAVSVRAFLGYFLVSKKAVKTSSKHHGMKDCA